MEKHILINVGRQFGSGGKAIAEVLGKKLSIKVYDNEVLTKASEKSGICAEMFERSDEKKSFLGISGLFGSNRFGRFTGNVLSEEQLFKMQSEAIREIASSSSAIFVGRASDYVLRDFECLDVFVCAPLEARVARVCERRGITADEAETLIARMDKGREDWYNFFTFSHWGVASNYDLCVDSSLLGIDGTADFIINFGRCTGIIQ